MRQPDHIFKENAMTHLKTTGIALLASLGLLACVGAAGASAKVCSTGGAGAACAAGSGNVYAGALDANLFSTTTASLAAGFGTVTCTSSTIQATVNNGGTGAAQISDFSFGSGCNAGGVTCVLTTSATEKSPWTTSIVHTAGVNGKVEIEHVKFTTACNSGSILCNYSSAKIGNGATPEIPLTGGESPVVKFKNVSLAKESGGALCANPATFNGEYEITTPASLFVE